MANDESNAGETISPPAALLPEMDHDQALRQLAVEKYLLNEMTPAARDQFEQHFFDCPECAMDLRVTAAFLDQAKQQLRTPQRRPLAKPARRPWVELLFRPAVVSPLFAVMLLLIVYQNFGPGSTGLGTPEVLSSASLVGGNARGGSEVPIVVAEGRPILLSVDVPAQQAFVGYELDLNSPTGTTLWRMPITAEQAKDTVSMRVPTTRWVPGEYRLIVYGHANGALELKDLAHYRFNFSNETQLSTGR